MNVATVSLTDPDASATFAESLRQTGFAIVTGSPLTDELVNAMTSAWTRFFAADARAKREYLHDRPGQATLCGFWPVSESETAVGASRPDLKEFFHVLPGASLPPGVARLTYRYRSLALDLGRRLLAGLADVDGGRLGERLSPAHSVLRIVHYPPLDACERPDAVRAAAHEDINLLTVLPVADAPGLEVRGSDGRWIGLAGRPGDVVINAGDMLAELSAERYPSTTHRVINPDDGSVARLAMPLFLTPHLDTVLSHRYTAGSYLEERLLAISGGSQRPPRSKH
ncbi:MAG: 2OG-Fe(II) oxygenase family protein [Pseudomonadota bacterium]